ncbi:hypothetical protein LTR56_021976 [Elasticomyces elasticus]|nr:hypothetical protein LTR56_021976 [Elasticomyces elasticus]KAK3630236.1 hypothetical protein LTR22_021614 [Elasticomyces elasticus]KAK5748967.1 hypothetical protein LTS12_021004 [Elasticomyces elasticus]
MEVVAGKEVVIQRDTANPQRKLFIQQLYNNNIQHTSKTKAATPARAKQAKEAANEHLPANMSVAAFKDWDDSTKLAGSGGELGENDAQWKATENKFAQAVEVMQNEAFFLKPLTVTKGPYKGRNILMLMPMKENEHIPFLELPPELPNMKYAFHFLDHDLVKICTYKPAKVAYGPKRAVLAGFEDSNKHEGLTWNATTGKWIDQGLGNFALLRVSKQRFEVAAAIAYENRLSFPDFSDATIFFKAIGSMIVHVKHVAIEELYSIFHTDGRAMFVLLAKAINLRTLRFEHGRLCGKTNFSRYARGVHGIVEMARPCLRKMHEARNGVEKAVQVIDLLQIGPADSCDRYKNGNDSCEYTECTRYLASELKLKCAESEEHGLEVAADLRSSLAKLLKKGFKLGSFYIMLGHIMVGTHAQHTVAEVGTEFQGSPIIVSEACAEDKHLMLMMGVYVAYVFFRGAMILSLLKLRGKESETGMLVSNWVLCVCDVLFGWHNVQCVPEGLRVGTAAIAIANSGGLFVVLCILTKRWFWPVEPQDGDAAEQGEGKKAV